MLLPDLEDFKEAFFFIDLEPICDSNELFAMPARDKVLVLLYVWLSTIYNLLYNYK
jgi:hypothetical protein